MKWVYGVTTVPARFDDLLPQTLHSLAYAGFGEPRLFVDGEEHPDIYHQRFDLDVTVRHPPVHLYPNWLLGMWELYLRTPDADRYAMFQDDLLAVRNLRPYLEQTPYPDNCYQNLFTFNNNEALVRDVAPGTWVKGETISCNTHLQKGLGAVGLVFSRTALLVLLGSPHLVGRMQNTTIKKLGLRRGYTFADGGIVEAMNRQGWWEYVHAPSLLAHTGKVSTTGSSLMPPARTFPGEDFDAMEWLT